MGCASCDDAGNRDVDAVPDPGVDVGVDVVDALGADGVWWVLTVVADDRVGVDAVGAEDNAWVVETP